MEKDLQTIDNFLKGELGNFAETPPAHIWNNIEANLNGKKENNKKYSFKKYAAVLLLLLFSTCGYYTFNYYRNNKFSKNEVIEKAENKKNTETTKNEGYQLNPQSQSNKIEEEINKEQNIKTQIGDNISLNNKEISKNEIVISNKKIENLNSQKKFESEKYSKLNTQTISASKKISINKATSEIENDGNNIVSIPNEEETKKLNFDNEIITAEKNTSKPLLLNINLASFNIPQLNKKNISNPIKQSYTLSAFYEPQLSLKKIKDIDHNPQMNPPMSGGGPGQDRERKKDFKQNESNQNAYAVGILVSKTFNKKWSAFTGLSFLSKKIDINPKKIYAKLDDNGIPKYKFECSTGYSFIDSKTNTVIAVGDSINTDRSENSTQYLSIPIGLSYNFNVGKFSFAPSVGANINFLVSQSITTSLVQNTTNEQQVTNNIIGLKSNYFNAFASFSANFKINKKIAIGATPIFNFALNSINKNTAVAAYDNSLGLMIGAKIKL